MSMHRRTFLGSLLGLTAVGATGASLVNAGQALSAPATPRQAPTEPFAVGVREFAWSRGDRQLITRIFYPATGAPGGNPILDAPIAGGVFPVVEFSHGLGGNPESYAPLVLPLAEAGFIVPAPVFPTTSTGTEGNIEDVYNGNQSMDVTEVITRTLALNESDEMFAGHLDTGAGVGVAGHSLGGMTTHGVLTAWPDARVVAAVPFACVDMGDPSGEVAANVLFVHGDQDPITSYELARQAYEELPAPRAFLTHLGVGHDEYIWSGVNHTQTVATYLDWMRWSLYGDTAARDRLPADASGDGIAWESVLT